MVVITWSKRNWLQLVCAGNHAYMIASIPELYCEKHHIIWNNWSVNCLAPWFSQQRHFPQCCFGVPHFTEHTCWYLNVIKTYISIWWGKFSQKHNYKYMAKWWCLLAMDKNYMFRPIAAIFRFDNFLAKRVLCNMSKPRGDVEISSSFYVLLLSYIGGMSIGSMNL